jgi:methylase of polypeptide subunit release factors
VLLHPKGGDLVMEIARQTNRFRLRDIQVDILKGLYENLIDPEQRHELGEYYTPDWLAERMCRATIHDPLDERVIDPACGSGTFLFHAVRRLIAAAEAADFSPAQAIARAVEKVAGIDVHPVAVIFARATYLLALMPTLQRGRPGSLSVPVYLGDALQWNAKQFMTLQDLEIIVPAQGEAARAEGGTISVDNSGKRAILRFPLSLASQRGLFDEALGEILSLAERDQPPAALSGWLSRKGFEDSSDVRMLIETYQAMRTLRKEGRNHLWGYVARNLSRPVWLASDAQKADVVVGNPPWLRYSSMSAANKQKFQEEMIKAGLWVGGKYATAQDLSSYFFARSVCLYMRQDGRIAFVMPYAAMSREPYRLFRTGSFKKHGDAEAQVRFTEAWTFPSDVQPLFPVPSCVLFAKRSRLTAPLPAVVRAFSGFLPRRDANQNEASTNLSERSEPWPADDGAGPSSPYRERFKNGATLWPRRLVIVERIVAGRLGLNPEAPLVRGRIGQFDKNPWKTIQPLHGPIEANFLRPVYLGQSLAPFRILEPLIGVIQWNEDAEHVLDSNGARARGFNRLAAWLDQAEVLWRKYGNKTVQFGEQLDYYGKLSSQFPISIIRIAFAKAGSNPATAILRDPEGIIENALYWLATEQPDEALFWNQC